MDTRIAFSSKFNYQKIATGPLSRTDTIPPGNTTITIPHAAGRISSARAWYDPGNGRRFPASFFDYSDDTTSISEVDLITVRSIYLTTTDLIITYTNNNAGSRDVTTFYRVYYDN